jgi:hypothetical protein
MPDEKANEVIKRWQYLDGDRLTWKSHWQQCANYMFPERSSYIVERTPGQKLMTWVYDGTPLWALDQFANGLHGFLTSTDVRWFGLHADDDAVNADYDCRVWLDGVSDILYDIFSGTKHTFAAQSHELYQDLGCIGTGVMSVLETPSGSIQFSTRHLKECVIAENDEDRVDTVVRRFQFTAKQAVQRWGAAAGEKVSKAFDEKPDSKFWFLHQVKPRAVRDPQRADSKHKAFESVYVSEDDAAVISEGGFDEFPFMAPRFMKSTGEIYGRSPGMRALPDIKMLNEMVKTVLKGAQKVVDPPLMLPDDGFMLPLRTQPGARIFYRAGMRPTDRIQPLETKGDIGLGREMVNDARQMIIRGFYVDWFIMPSDMTDPASDGKGVTATFTQQQRAEKMRQASPMVARMQGEFTGPLIERTFNILWRQSKLKKFGPGSPFPQPPPKINGRPLHVEYVSPLAIAQKSSELDSVSRLVQTTLGLMQVDPDAGSVLSAERIIRRTSRDLNAPADALKSPDEMAAYRQAQADAAKQQQEQQALLAATKGAKDGTGALSNLASMQAQGAAQGAAGAGYGPPSQAAAA